MSGEKIIKALDEVLAWSRGGGTLPVWLPDGSKVDVTVSEYEALRLGAHDEFAEKLADANTKEPTL